jgi:hypothetical protein
MMHPARHSPTLSTNRGILLVEITVVHLIVQLAADLATTRCAQRLRCSIYPKRSHLGRVIFIMAERERERERL